MKDKQKIQEVLSGIFDQYGVKKAILFGSYAKGEATENSDVDLYVESGLKGLKFVALLEAVCEILGNRKVDLIDRTHIEYGSRVEQEIMTTGIVIYER